jgi:N-acetylglucosaminyldiphosphoundecaprenol N-acetyl-beta-D-mannosaminyltransferase
MPKFHHICVLNANKMWIADRDIELRRILCGSELVIPEYAIVWGCRVLGTPLRSHVGGIMLLKALLPWLESNAISVYFLGARPDVVELMQARLRLRYPGLKVAGAHSGYFNAEDSPQILKDINDSGARMLFVAMGSPRQERWIESHREHLRVQVAMGVGGSFDVLAGVKKDAAPWMRHGGEWLYRLLQDPRNLWKRYLTTNPWFVARVLREKFLPCKVSTPTGTL